MVPISKTIKDTTLRQNNFFKSQKYLSNDTNIPKLTIRPRSVRTTGPGHDQVVEIVTNQSIGQRWT